MPIRRHISSTGVPNSVCRRAKLICSSVYRFRFMALPPPGSESARKIAFGVEQIMGSGPPPAPAVCSRTNCAVRPHRFGMRRFRACRSDRLVTMLGTVDLSDFRSLVRRRSSPCQENILMRSDRITGSAKEIKVLSKEGYGQRHVRSWASGHRQRGRGRRAQSRMLLIASRMR